MASSLVHPRKQKARQQFYPHLVSIGKLSGSATSNDANNWKFAPIDDNHVDLSCAYGAKEGGKPGAFQTDASSGEAILLSGFYPGIQNKLQAVLTLYGTKKYFTITDVLLSDGKTLLVVTPRK